MYKKTKGVRTTLSVNNSYEGEDIETKVARMFSNGETIGADVGLIYTQRSEGVLPGHDIRTDRWEVARDAMDYHSRSNTAKREALLAAKSKKEKGEGGENKSGNPSQQPAKQTPKNGE